MFQLIRDIKIFFGYEICPKCGSYNIKKSGFPESNLRYSCKDCGTTTYMV